MYQSSCYALLLKCWLRQQLLALAWLKSWRMSRLLKLNDHVSITCCFLVAFLLPPCFAAFSIVRLSTCSDFKKEKKKKSLLTVREYRFIISNGSRTWKVCLVVLYMYMSVWRWKTKKIFMRSIYMTKYHWNVKPDNVMMQIMMIVFPPLTRKVRGIILKINHTLTTRFFGFLSWIPPCPVYITSTFTASFWVSHKLSCSWNNAVARKKVKVDL